MSAQTAGLTLFGVILMASVPVAANSQTGMNNPDARALVADYRELRRDCATKTGVEKKACFHALRAYNGQYRVAKEQLELGHTDDRDNIHLVIF